MVTGRPDAAYFCFFLWLVAWAAPRSPAATVVAGAGASVTSTVRPTGSSSTQVRPGRSRIGWPVAST